ncbi:uncharacterized protein LOC135821784 [Sycon ciliatum]|uniref:uncharacterized protein LOC135821784 n=1 Tax=Sycon ciliatum TaxID=27933 RepID=UPI0020AABFBA|eukprot:scpid69938/ scgid31867/ Ras-like protein rasS
MELRSRDRTQSDCVRNGLRSRDVSPLPLATLTSNQLHKLLGDEECADRKRSVSISGLRRSRTFTAADSTRNRRIVPVLQSSTITMITATPSTATAASSSEQNRERCSSLIYTDCDSCPQPARVSRSTSIRSRVVNRSSGGRVAAAKTVGRTPPPLGRSFSVLRRNSSSLRRMNSLRPPPSEAQTGPAAAAASGPAEQFVPKIAIVGAEATGKSTIVTRWLKGSAPQSTFYEPTIEDRFQHTTTINGREQVVEIIDTSGADDLGEMRYQSMKSAHAIVLVYDITQPTSLSWLRQAYHDMQRSDVDHSAIRPVLVMVGNKVDCQERRQVSSLDGAAMAKDLFQCEYMETSAHSGVQVDEVLKRVVKQLGKKASVLSKASVSRSRSFLQKTVGAIRPKRRPKIPTQWDSSSGDIATLRPTTRGNVRMKKPAAQPGESNV